MKTFKELVEKTLTPAELKKREEIAKAMERENPDMDMGKKMAIATAAAKRVAEETESVEEANMSSDRSKQMFKRKELDHELRHEVEPKRAEPAEPHAVHINGKKWKTFSTKSHATNVAKKIAGATVVKESLDEATDHHADAMEHKKQSDAAMVKNDMEAYHQHMSAHHESLGQWHESKGRSSSAQKEFDKAEGHHELSLKKSNQKNEGIDMLSFKYFQQALVEAKKKTKESSCQMELAHGEMLDKDEENGKEKKEMYVKEGEAPVAPVPGTKSKTHAIMVHPESKQRVTIPRKNIKNYPASEGWKEVAPGMKESVEELDEAITHVVAKDKLAAHKEFMDKEGFKVTTKPLPKSHPKHATHMGIVSKNSQESSYHEDGNAHSVSESVEFDESYDELNMRHKFVFNKTPAGKAREVARNREELKSQMKRQKEMGGITGPKGKLPEAVEDAEQIDELKSSTLKRYIKKAEDSYAKTPAPQVKARRGAGLDRADDKLERKANNRNPFAEEYEIDEELKGDMHPDAGKVLKDIKPEHHDKYKPYLKNGVYKGNYADRSAVLRAAEKAGHTVNEAASPFDWKAYAKEKGPESSNKTKTFHDVKKTSTGTVYTKQVNPDGTSKGSGDDAAKSAEVEQAPKRGRGRPAGVGAKTGSYKPRDPAAKAASAAKAAASKAANRAARNEEFDNEFMGSLIEGFEDEDFDDFLQCEEFDELDEATQEALINFINEKSCGSYKMKESLTGKQHKLDKNKNGKIDSHDFKLLRKEETEQVQESVDKYAAFLNKKQ